MTLAEQANPFKVQSPEKLAADDAVDLFVNVFTDFNKIKDPGHSFLNGPRGCGKSMMFRYLQPDCQCLVRQTQLHGIASFGVYVPLKNTTLDISELERLDGCLGATQINEHLMTLFLAVEATKAVIDALPLADGDRAADPANRERFVDGLHSLLAVAGMPESGLMTAFLPEPSAWLKETSAFFATRYGKALQFVRHLAFSTEVPSFAEPLLGYLDFLHPYLNVLRSLSFLPTGPVFLLIDDADNLSRTQTMVLNSWVSSRTSAEVSIKVSTQMQYKTFQTTSGLRVDATHDFSEINIADIYTSSRGKYLDRVREIVDKRLRKYGVCDDSGGTPSPDAFFPRFEKQELEIEEIREELREKHETEGRARRPSDDVIRYARPMYMARLAGTRKASSKYMYAGFEQLVHISSGIIRQFLEPAAHMFSEVQASSPGKRVLRIRPIVQDEVVRADSYNFRFSELEKIRDDEALTTGELETIEKLGRLIEVVGGVFRQCLLAEGRAERRVFSIALYDEPDDELRGVLRLGVRYGYFHRSSIGRKDGMGRTRLYILSRRLAPAFNLDPNGFVGYLWMNSETLKEAIHRPARLLKRIKASGGADLPEAQQLTLFD